MWVLLRSRYCSRTEAVAGRVGCPVTLLRNTGATTVERASLQ